MYISFSCESQNLCFISLSWYLTYCTEAIKPSLLVWYVRRERRGDVSQNVVTENDFVWWLKKNLLNISQLTACTVLFLESVLMLLILWHEITSVSEHMINWRLFFLRTQLEPHHQVTWDWICVFTLAHSLAFISSDFLWLLPETAHRLL